MKAGSLNWNETSGEGEATLTKEFEALGEVDRLDALHDWINDLTEQYNSLLEARAVIFKAKKA